MLRRILISLGLIIAFLPWLGFPHSWQAVISTVTGFSIVLLLLLSRRIRSHQNETGLVRNKEGEGKALHVEHIEIIDRPEMHVERETIVETETTHESPSTETVIERRATVTRRRRKNDMPNEDEGMSVE